MSRKYLVAGGVLTVVAAIMGGCTTSSYVSSSEDIQRALSQDTSPTTQRYVLGATDVIQVSVWRNPDLSVSVPVRPDGMISVPLLGDVKAAGKTPELLAYDIETGLTEFIREPQVSIVVTSMGSHEFTDRVRVTGAVQNPVSVPHRQGMTVLDMFLNAGAANPFADLNGARLYRSVGDDVVAIPVKLDDIITRGDVSTNYTMRPGDILAVPERNF